MHPNRIRPASGSFHKISMEIRYGQVVGSQLFGFGFHRLHGLRCAVFALQHIACFQAACRCPSAVGKERMDGVGDQSLGFIAAIANMDIDGLGVGIAVLRAYGFVGGFAIVYVSDCLI